MSNPKPTPDPPHVRYQDNPDVPDDPNAVCHCPECSEARGEVVTDEMRRRHQRAMSKYLETKRLLES